MTEYVKLSRSEKNYGQKNLLQAQLSLLEVTKHCKAYQDFRKEELILKITLKNKVDQVKENLAILDKILPKTKFMDKHESKDSREKSDIFAKKDLSLEQEIDKIRRKLSSLR